MTTPNEELRKLAEAATPGPWTASYCCIESDNGGMIIYDEGGHSEKDAKYIAAANPAKVIELLDRIDRLEAGNERAQEAFHQIKSWSEAYPLQIFPEPDFQKAHEVLTANGMTLDAISASNMRHVITRVKAIVDAVIPERKETP